MNPVGPKLEQVADRPAAREGGTENLGADQYGGADDGQHVLPSDRPPSAPSRGFMGPAPLREKDQAASRAAFVSSRPASTSASRMRVDLGAAELHQRRAHHGARQAAEQHQRLLHAVVHVGPGLGIEHPRQRLDAVVEPLRRAEVVVLHRVEQLAPAGRRSRCRCRRAGRCSRAPASENSHALWVESTFTGRGRLCSVRMCISCCGTLPDQSLMARMDGTSSHIFSSVSRG